MTGSDGAVPLDGVIAVFDLEWTTWEGAQARNWSGPGEEREIVEIGAVKLDGRNSLREISAFDMLVRPRLNPLLSDYFTGLTGDTHYPNRLIHECIDVFWICVSCSEC